MNVNKRINALAKLGSKIQDESWQNEIIPAAKAQNNWFTAESIKMSLDAIANEFLDQSKLENWISTYELKGLSPKKVALVLAGNIPAVGFHDVLCVLMAGHIACIKLSSKDQVIIKRMLLELVEIEPEFKDRIQYIERIENADAVIATGSNNTSMYFEHYFSKYPHIIRKNRKSVAVIYPETTDDELRLIANDMLSYYGLGCRNVSKVYIHSSVDRSHLMEIWNESNQVILHNKYKNNYDYNYTVYLLNKEDFLMNGAFVLREDKSLHSRIACIHYEVFEDINTLGPQFQSMQEELQCIVSSHQLDDLVTVLPGQAQKPSLSDYADHIDTITFLKNI